MGYLKHCFFAEVMISKTEYKQGTLAEKVDTMTKMFDIKTFSGMFCFAAVITLTSCANHFHHIISLIYIDMWTRYMSQMLYAGQSARPSVTFLSDFQELQRAQFMYQVHEILIHESQPICNPSGQILWSWVVLGLIYGRSNFCHKFYQVPHQRPDLSIDRFTLMY